MTGIEELFESGGSDFSPKDKVDIIGKEVTLLEEFYDQIINHKMDRISDVSEFLGKIETLTFSYKNVMNEVNQDIMAELEDCPHFKTFFKLWFKNMKEDNEEEKIERWIRFKAKTSGQLAESLNRLVPLMAKMVAIHSLLFGINVRATQKSCNRLMGQGLAKPMLMTPQEEENKLPTEQPIISVVPTIDPIVKALRIRGKYPLLALSIIKGEMNYAQVIEQHNMTENEKMALYSAVHDVKQKIADNQELSRNYPEVWRKLCNGLPEGMINVKAP